METFEIFAEMSIAMLGFSGLMVAISDVSSIVVARVKGLLFFASIAAICSVIPLTGLEFNFMLPRIHRISACDERLELHQLLSQPPGASKQGDLH